MTVPSFVGQTLGDANAEIARLQAKPAVVDHTTSDRYPKDVVIMQRPERRAGAQGRQISFVISDGIVARLMPDLRYQSMREVSSISRERTCSSGERHVSQRYHPRRPRDLAESAPLVNVHEGDIVTLVVSQGGRPAHREGAELRRMTIDQARDWLGKAGIKLGQIVWTPLGRNGPPHGWSRGRFHPPGARSPPYEPVSLQVSAGPNESGYIVRQARVLVSVPAPEDVDARRPTRRALHGHRRDGRYDLYHAFRAAGAETRFHRHRRRHVVLDMYVNDQLVGEERAGHRTAARLRSESLALALAVSDGRVAELLGVERNAQR